MKTLIKVFLVVGGNLLGLSSVIAADTRDIERKSQSVSPKETGEEIVFQWSGGKWSNQSLAGSYRVVITKADQSPGNKLYLQWWANSRENGVELAYSTGVGELNRSPDYQFSNVECLDSDCKKLKVIAQHSYEEYWEVFNISMEKLGSYRLLL